LFKSESRLKQAKKEETLRLKHKKSKVAGLLQSINDKLKLTKTFSQSQKSNENNRKSEILTLIMFLIFAPFVEQSLYQS